MNKIVYVFLMLVTLCCARYGFAYQGTLDGEVMVTPPRFSEPPEIVVVPSERYPNQYVYMVPQMEGVYVHQGMWYRHYRGIWFHAASYDAQWYPVSISVIPPLIISVPTSYALYLPHDYYRIRYWDYHEQWRYWDNGHHWHNHHWFRHEMRPDIRQERIRHITPHHNRDMREGHLDRRHDIRDRNFNGPDQKPRPMEKPAAEQRIPHDNHFNDHMSNRDQRRMAPVTEKPPAHHMQAPLLQQPPTNIIRQEQTRSHSRQPQNPTSPPPLLNQGAQREHGPDRFLRQGHNQQQPQQREMREQRGQIQQAPPRQQPPQQIPQIKQQSPPPATQQQQQQVIPTSHERRMR